MRRQLRGLLVFIVLAVVAHPAAATSGDADELIRRTRLHFAAVEHAGACLLSDDMIVHSIAIENERATLEVVVEQHSLSARDGAPRVVHQTVEWKREAGAWRLSRSAPTEERLAASLTDQAALARFRQRLQRDVHLRNTAMARALTARSVEVSNIAADADLAEAIAWAAMELSSDLGDVSGVARAFFARSAVERQRGDMAEALVLGNDSIAMAEQSGDADAMALAYNNLGRIYGSSHDRRLAATFYRKALALESRVVDKRIVIHALMNLTSNAGIQGDFLTALQYSHRTVEVAEKWGNRVDRAAAASNTASLYLLQGGDPERALKAFETALPAFRAADSPKKYLAAVLGAMADCLRLLGETAKAAAHYEESLVVAAAAGDFRTEGISASQLAKLKLQGGDVDEAWRLFERTLEIGRKTADTELQSRALPGMAEIRVRRNDAAGAVRLAEDAVEAARKSRHPALYVNALTVLSRVHRSTGRVGDARRGFEEAIEKYEELRNRTVGGEDEIRRGFEGKLSPYLELINLLVEQRETSGALAVAERLKARLLLDVLHSGRTEITKFLTPQEKEAEQALRKELVQLNRTIQAASSAKTRDESHLNELRARLESKRMEYERFQADLYVRHPDLKVTRARTKPLAAADLEALALPRRDMALVEFVVADDRTHVFLMTAAAKSPILVHTEPIGRESLERLVGTLTTQLGARDLRYRHAARELYERFLKPFASELRRARVVCIVPDGALWNVPFQVLMDDSGRHLIDRFAVFHAPSISVLALAGTQRGKPSAGKLLLAFGNPAPMQSTADRVRSLYRSEDLGALPDAETEVQSLAEIYGAARSRIYVGAAAEEKTAKAEMNGYRIVHFATHGVLTDRHPLYSHLLLSPSKTDGDEDGLLEAWEMLNLDLQADLVVLSACETARGRIGAGEGLIGMAWAMFVAGARATVASHWKVESNSTTRMMVDFHRRLLDARATSAQGKAEALREAQLGLLRDPRYRHPYYWSPFVLLATGW